MRKIIWLTMMFVSTVLMAFPNSFLMPEEAFKPKSRLLTNQHIEAVIGLGEGIYVYRDKLDVSIVSPESISVKDVIVSTLAESHDGDMVYMNDVVMDIVLASGHPTVQEVSFELNFQGCSDKGLCYEPQSHRFSHTVDFSKVASAEETSVQDEILPEQSPAPKLSKAPEVESSETDLIVDTLKGGSLWAVLALFFGFGLALSLTPCIFPMIPILSSIIVSQGKDLNAKRGFILSLVYVLAMSVAYAIAGVMAGLFGENLQVLLQNPFAIGIFALIFIALAFSMFGFYEIGLPASLQTRLSRVSDEAGEKGGFIGVAVMGFLSALIVGPCVAPGLAAALIYIGQTGNAMLGGAALFVMSLGMGIPLLLIGLGAGRFMPRPGGWMDTMTKVFGAVMIGIAIWMLSRVIPEAVTIILWAIFFIVSAVYMGAMELLQDSKRGWNALFKGVGIVFLIYGAMLMIGAMSGSTSLTQPLKNFTPSSITHISNESLEFEVIHSGAELDAILERSKGQRVMLDFWAKWCSACEEYETITFQDERVKDALKTYILVQADVTDNTLEEKALMKRFGLFGPPGVIFFDRNGLPLPSKTIIGYQEPEKFLEHLKEIK